MYLKYWGTPLLKELVYLYICLDQGSQNFTARGPHELSSSMLRADEPYTVGQGANILIKQST